MNEAAITEYITTTFADVRVGDAWGDSFFYYNPDPHTPDELYFATLKGNDDDYDNASNLKRPSVFRLNIGLSKASYRALFGGPPPRPEAGAAHSDQDFTVLDQLLPHPVYGRQYWVCILNPSAATFQSVVQPLLAEAYEVAVSKYTKRAARHPTPDEPEPDQPDEE